MYAEGNIDTYVHTDIFEIQEQVRILKKKDQNRRITSAVFMPCDLPER